MPEPGSKRGAPESYHGAPTCPECGGLKGWQEEPDFERLQQVINKGLFGVCTCDDDQDKYSARPHREEPGFE